MTARFFYFDPYFCGDNAFLLESFSWNEMVQEKVHYFKVLCGWVMYTIPATYV